MSYPIDELIPSLVDALVSHSAVVVQAPPGAGKTTQVPVAMLQASWCKDKKILMLEPRRLAARAAARFMAQQLGEHVGETVGYRVRMDSNVGPNTRIEVVTEGILTRLLQADPELTAYALVIFDEFHERNLLADLGLALCLDVQSGLREDLKLIIMSATLDGATVSALLDAAPILTSEGRSYPVAVHYRAPSRQYARDRRGFLAELTQVIRHAIAHEDGSVLVFLPGVGEIRQVASALEEARLGPDVVLAPLYGQLSQQDQDAAIQPAPSGKRKIVLASAIAETSLTIEGIRIVIDSGLMRVPRFDPNTGLTQLHTLPVSRASADQRSGRAGRMAAGVCYRLWSQTTHLLPQTAAEILEADLAPLMLELAQWGVKEPYSLRWLDPPPSAHVEQARELLLRLGALTADGRLTAHGRKMGQWPIHPRLAHMLLRAEAMGFGALACDVAAILGERDVLRGESGRQTDLQLRIEALRDNGHDHDDDRAAIRRARKTASQWRQQLQIDVDPSNESLHLLGVTLALAYPDRIGKRRDNTSRYLLSNGRGASLPEGDALSTQSYLVAANLDGAKEARIFLAAGIYHGDLIRYHVDLIRSRDIVRWDEHQACVQASRQKLLGELVLEQTPQSEPDHEAVLAAMLEGIRLHGISCLPWSDTAVILRTRIQFVHEHIDSSWPDLSNQILLEQLDVWLGPYLNRVTRLSHLARLDLHTILLAQLTYEQQRQLDSLVPTHLLVPSGSRVRIDYSQSPPVLAVRIQEMFGLADTPSIGNGKIPLQLHLLSPARRPVQITQDLAGFWASSYHDVKRDMKGRYPKHDWPDDPLHASATSIVRRKDNA